MRLIDTDEIKLPKGFFEKVTNVPKFYEWLDSLPTVDAVPVAHGEWKPGKEISRTMLGDETLAIEYDAFYCSTCGCRYKEYVLIYNHCPNCGAKMNGGANIG